MQGMMDGMQGGNMQDMMGMMGMMSQMNQMMQSCNDMMQAGNVGQETPKPKALEPGKG